MGSGTRAVRRMAAITDFVIVLKDASGETIIRGNGRDLGTRSSLGRYFVDEVIGADVRPEP